MESLPNLIWWGQDKEVDRCAGVPGIVVGDLNAREKSELFIHMWTAD